MHSARNHIGTLKSKGRRCWVIDWHTCVAGFFGCLIASPAQNEKLLYLLLDQVLGDS